MVVAAARVAAGEVMVGALVPILVPVVGLVQVAAVLLLLLLEVGQLCWWRWWQLCCFCWRRTVGGQAALYLAAVAVAA